MDASLATSTAYAAVALYATSLAAFSIKAYFNKSFYLVLSSNFYVVYS